MEKGITIELFPDIDNSFMCEKIIFRKYINRLYELIAEFRIKYNREPEYINFTLKNDKKIGQFCNIPMYTNKKEENKMSDLNARTNKILSKEAQLEQAEKPYDLIEAITNLDTLIIEIKILIEKVIKENPSKIEGDEIKKQVFNSLFDLLEKGPNEISKFKIEMSQCIKELDELLFKKGRKI